MCLSTVVSTEMRKTEPRKAYKCFIRRGGGYTGIFHGCGAKFQIGETYYAVTVDVVHPGICYRMDDDGLFYYPAGFHSFPDIESAKEYRNIHCNYLAIIEVEYQTQVATGTQDGLPCIVHHDMKLIKEVA